MLFLAIIIQVVRGTRNFTCTNNQLNDGYSEASAKVDDNTPNISGDFFYDSIGFPTFTLDVGGSSKFVPRKIVLFKEYLETPSPSGPNVYPWARWKVLSDTGSPPFAYVERRDTTEGGLPASTCTGPTATSPFGGKFNFYACNPPGVSPPLPKSPPAVRASPPVVPVPSTEAASIVATPAGAPTSNKPPAAAVVAASPTTPPSGAHSIFSVQAVVMAFMSAAIGFMW